jgi:hypothetical protein
MRERLKTSVTASFKDIFPDEQKPNIEDLIIDIPSKTLIKIIAHFMAQIHSKEDNFELQKEIIFRFINQQDNETREYILNNFENLIDKSNSDINFFNNISSLYFYQEIFKNYNSYDSRDLTADEELRLIKAYLLVSEKWIDREIEHLNQKPTNDNELIAYVLPFQMAHNEIQSYKDFRPQLIKAIFFFQYLEQDKDLGPYLTEFVSQYGLNNWKEYLRNTIIPYVISFTGSKSTILTFNENNQLEIDYWNSFCISTENYQAKRDFLELRENPVFKLDEYNYLFLNYNFIIDKLFQSLQFVFSKMLIDKGVVSSFSDFKSKYYSEKFSENYMFYDVIKYCIGSQSNIVAYNGRELENLLGEKGPDYYIRINNHIILTLLSD